MDEKECDGADVNPRRRITIKEVENGFVITEWARDGIATYIAHEAHKVSEIVLDLLPKG